jgi:hypothetical protein
VNVGDFDSDGHLDIVAGIGVVTRYQEYLAKPIHFFYGDPDRQGVVNIVEAYYAAELDKVVPFRDWETLSAVFPFIRRKYSSFTEFSTASVSEFMGDRMGALSDLQVNTSDSIVLLNRGTRFELRPLPVQAQVAPIFGLAEGDLDGDGAEDILCTQNLFGVPPLVSRLDGGCGAFLRGDRKGGFKFVPVNESGIAIYGEGRGAALCDYDHDGRLDAVATQNANQTKLYRNQGARPGLRVILHGNRENPQAIGAMIRLKYRDGTWGAAREIHAGGGYWSQDAATQVLGLGSEPETILVRWPGGGTTVTPIPKDNREANISRDGRLITR